MTAREGTGGAAEARGRMRRALREAVARSGGVRRVSGLSLIALLCVSVVAPAAVAGLSIGPLLAAWLGAAGSVGSNLLADVITKVVGERGSAGESADPGVQAAVAAELEARMAGAGPQASALRGEVAALLRANGAQQVLVEALAEGDSGLQVALAESVALLAGRFEEFAELIGAVREGVRDLQQASAGQQTENRAQAEHREQVLAALDRILELLEHAPLPAGEAAVVYNALPPDTAAFTGRHAESGEIIGQVAAAAVRGGVIAIHAIDGMPGIGKSALAVHVARLLADRFPDRRLFVDLHAHSADRGPADPAALLASLLTGDGLDPRQLPTELEHLSALWRTRMAGLRVLLVLDDAVDSAQVAPLIPGGSAALVLVTSRRHLGDLPYAVTEIPLDVLPPGDAVAMFVRLAPRAAGEEEQVADLVALAGYLPLAVSLLARVYTRHRAWSIGELVDETRARLLTLSAEHHTVAAAFDLSYRTLLPPRQRFFRLLGLHPGGDLDTYAAAALTGTSLTQAEEHLDALVGDNLVTEPAYRRYGMHDLMRTHARTLAVDHDTTAEREEAVDRLLRYYAHTAQTASVTMARNPRLAPDGPAPDHAPALTDPDVARTWLRTERTNLDAAFAYAYAHGLDDHVVAISVGMAEILHLDGPFTRAFEILQAGVDAAERSRSSAARGAALTELGRVLFLTGQFPEAVDAQTRALNLFRALGNRLGEAIALTELGRVKQQTGEFSATVDAETQALNLFRTLGDRLGEATALINLGRVQYTTGAYLEASDTYTRALSLFRALGNRLGEATALNSLGQVRFVAGQYPETIEAHTRALNLVREHSSRLGEATILTDLGFVRQAIGDYPGAVDAYTLALDLFRTLGNRLGEAAVLSYLGRVKQQTGDYSGAVDACTHALDLFRVLGSRFGEASALVDLGRAKLQGGDISGAIDAHGQALDLFHAHGNPGDEASALNYYAAAIAASGDHDRALSLYRQALAVHQELGKPDDEAISLEGIAECHLATGDAAQGTEYLSQALAIYQRLGMLPDVERVQARTADLAP